MAIYNLKIPERKIMTPIAVERSGKYIWRVDPFKKEKFETKNKRIARVTGLNKGGIVKIETGRKFSKIKTGGVKTLLPPNSRLSFEVSPGGKVTVDNLTFTGS